MHQLAETVAADLADGHCWTPLRGWFWRSPEGLWARDEEASVLGQMVFDLIGEHELRGGRVHHVVNELQYPLAFFGGWDLELQLAGLPNGQVLYLADGTIRDASRSDRITRRLGAVPDFEKTPTRWLQLISHVCENDTEMERPAMTAGVSGCVRRRASSSSNPAVL